MKRHTPATLALLGALVGCYGDSPMLAEPQHSEGGVDAVTEDDAYFSGGGYVLPKTHVGIIRQIGFEEVSNDEIAIGFDLDGTVSPEDEAASCGHGDFTDPDGRQGIDNQFSEVWTIIKPIVGEQVEALLLNAINDGRFLLLIELSDVEDLQNDDDITMTVLRGMADPLVNSMGQLMSDQTYYVDPDYPISVVDNVSIVDGTIEAGPVNFSIPVEIFEADFLVEFQSGRLRFEIHEDGSFEGVLGGKMHVQDALDKLLSTNAAAEAELVAPFLIESADIERDGDVCAYMSAAFSFRTAGAFIVRYPEDQAD